jgi:hypothetical protein
MFWERETSHCILIYIPKICISARSKTLLSTYPAHAEVMGSHSGQIVGIRVADISLLFTVKDLPHI